MVSGKGICRCGTLQRELEYRGYTANLPFSPLFDTSSDSGFHLPSERLEAFAIKDAVPRKTLKDQKLEGKEEGLRSPEGGSPLISRQSSHSSAEFNQ